MDPESLQSTTTFVLDPSSQELGDPIRNTPGKLGPRRKVTDQHFGRCLITGYLQGWHRVTASGHPASLLLFHFNFTFTKRRKFRYKFGEIKLTIEDSEDVKPDIVDMYPHNIPGTTAAESEVGDKTVTMEEMRVYAVKQTNCQNPERDNVCRWLIDESPGKGIPDFFPCAVVISDNGKPFKVDIEVRVTASMALVTDPGSWGLYAHLWKDDPLEFNNWQVGRFPALPVSLSSMDWSTISDKQWKWLVPFPLLSKVVPWSSLLILQEGNQEIVTSPIELEGSTAPLLNVNQLSLNTPAPEYSHADYKVGWMCAVNVEVSAAVLMLEKQHNYQPQHPKDNNCYILGHIGQHNIVIVCLPAGEYGNNAAVHAASNLIRSFENIRFVMMVGIAGGVPNPPKNDIRLGDVVVSQPKRQHSGVIQHDFGKLETDKFVRSGVLDTPAYRIRTAITALQGRHRVYGIDKINQYISQLPQEFHRPINQPDHLFEGTYIHPRGQETCANCDPTRQEKRSERKSNEPVIHYGLIGSGNQVIKDGVRREKLAEEGVLAIEMETAGLMNIVPSVAIRGICDYSDSHKNALWQGYAAATAAAYAKDLLTHIAPEQKHRTH